MYNGAEISSGIACFRTKDEEINIPFNVIPSPAVRTMLFNSFAYDGGNLKYLKHQASPGFNRFSSLRYYKDKSYLESLYIQFAWIDSGYNIWLSPSFSDTAAGNTMQIQDSAAESLALSNKSLAVGSLNMVYTSSGSTFENQLSEYPNSSPGNPLLSSVDLPGTTIGNLFKHPIGRTSYFNETGQIALSQGNIQITGVFDPPENIMNHMAYQVYHTKSGGTGKIDTGVGSQTNGQLYAGGGGDDYFADADAHTHFVAGTHDNGNWYIAIRSGTQKYTYKIKSIKGASPSAEVYIDSKDVNQGVSNEGPGLSWTLREGPIAEYFFRRMKYASGDNWYYYPTYDPNYGGVPMNYTLDRTYSATTGIDYHSYFSVIRDRGCCWWLLGSLGETDASGAGYGLARWVEMSHSGLDYPYMDGDITNMPTGIRYWRDIDIDGTSSNKLWIGIDDSTTSVGYSLFKIDPHPSGNARYPNCVSKFSKQTGPTDASGLPSKNVRGICCDRFNNRIWAICGNDGAGGNGGIAFTEDGGSTWSRMIKQTTITGTGAVQATGSITFPIDVKASGSIVFSSNPSDADWVEISDGFTQPLKFEFESSGGVTPGNIAVTIGATSDDTAENLKSAINTAFTDPVYSEVGITASHLTSSNTVTLLNNYQGTSGNIAMTKSCSAITISGMSGGQYSIQTGEKVTINDGYTVDPLGSVDYWFRNIYSFISAGWINLVNQPSDGETFTLNDSLTTITFEFDNGGGVTPGNVAITIGVDVATTRTNTRTTINGSSTTINATGVSNTRVYLQSRVRGTASNIAITKSGTFTVAGMARAYDLYYGPSVGNTGTTSVTFGTPSGMYQTLTGLTGGTFNTKDNNSYLKITGASSNNSGTFLITSVLSATSVIIYNGGGTNETVSCTWEQFGNKNNILVELMPTNSDTTRRTAIVDAINNSYINITASAGSGAVVNLVNDYYGDQGNITITDTVSDSGFVPSGLVNGNAWEVAGDGVTLTNPKGDSAFNTELAAGDWITLQALNPSSITKRRVASITNANTLVLHSSIAYPGAVEGHVGLHGEYKGILTDAQCRLYFSSTTGNSMSTDGYVHPPCDYDTDGYLYWVPDSVGATGSDPAVCRVSPSNTNMPSTLTNTNLSGGQTFTNARSVMVSKFSNVAGSGTTSFQNNIWVGSYNTDMTRIYNWTGPSITRYHHSSTNSWPTSINLLSNNTHYTMRAVQDLIGGTILLIAKGINNLSADCYTVQVWTKNTHPTFGQVTRLGSAWYSLATIDAGGQSAYDYYTKFLGINFDDLGMSSFYISNNCVYRAFVRRQYATSNLPKSFWVCFRWNGSSWLKGIINGASSNIDFAGVLSPAGPHTECTTTCGFGTKRAMEIETPLDNGLYIKFVQAGGGTSQSNEFIIDENTTFVCSIGRAKDNTMTASYLMNCHYLPSVARIDEPIVNAESLWTSDDGIDGGYVNDATDTTNPTYMRGVAEYSQFYASATTNYPNMAHTWSGAANPHYMAARRIRETFYDAGDLDIWNDSGVGKAQCPTGTYTFTNSADVNKTLRVHGAATGGNNTSKLITSVDEITNTVTLSSAWAAAENDRKWTLRLIPAVGYIVLTYSYTDTSSDLFIYSGYKLFSSINAGYTWDAVKSTKYFSGVAANDPITKVGAVGYIDAGVFIDAFTFNAYNFGLHMMSSANRSIVFDVRELSQEARRRTHWKIHRENSSGAGSSPAYPATVLLLDENYVPMGTSSLFISDRDDSRFVAMLPSISPRAIMYDSTNAAIGVDMGYGYSFTDVIQVGGGESFYEQNGTDLIAWANTTQVKSATATFTASSIGKKIRATALSVTGGTYDGFVTINSIVNSTTVLVSRTIASQANGSITGVTNNGGQAVFASASHTLSNGDAVTIAGTTNYNGNWIVANVVAGVSFEASVSYVSSQTGTWNKGQTGLTWAVTKFAPTDKVRFDDNTTFFKHVGKALSLMTYEVIDVPASNRIQTKYKDIPLSVSSTFVVEREFVSVVENWQQTTSWDTLFACGWAPRTGIFQVSDAAQFNLIQEDTSETASSAADDDGDNWTNAITLTGITLSSLAQADDWICLNKSSGYRRWYKIKSITSYGPGATLTVYEDEIVPSTTFRWKICRKNGLKMRIPAVNIVGSSQI